MRAKFIVYGENRSAWGTVTYLARPVTSESEENKSFFRTTPAGDLSVTVKPSETEANLELGVEYYVDFTKAI
jgi:hypothetical protein